MAKTKTTVYKPAKITVSKMNVSTVSGDTVYLENLNKSQYTFLSAKEARKMAKKLIECAKYIESK